MKKLWLRAVVVWLSGTVVVVPILVKFSHISTILHKLKDKIGTLKKKKIIEFSCQTALFT